MDEASRAKGPGPVRTCIGCGRRFSQGMLIRLAVVEGKVVLDPNRTMPGRGAWICPNRDCLDRLMSRKGRDRVFRRALDENAWADLGRHLVSHLADRNE